MILATDVYYTDTTAIVAGVAFNDWSGAEPVHEYVSQVAIDSAYVPGEFYKRELPCLLALLREHELSPHTIVVDGYVYLDGERRAGLGKHLYDALDGSAGIIGVAKSEFAEIPQEFALLRGASTTPLYITAVGCSVESARQNILSMSGPYRIPTLLKRVDALCRQNAVRSQTQE